MRSFTLNAGQQGILLVLAYVTLSSANAVYLSGFLTGVDVFGTLLVVFVLIALVFWSICAARGGVGIPWRNRPVAFALLGVNLTTVGSWFSFFLAVRSMEPALTSVIGNAVMPLTALVFTALVLRVPPRSHKELLVAAALLLCMLGTGWTVFSGRTALRDSAPVLGFAASVLCGVSVALNTVVSKRLNILGFDAAKILATRFFALIMLAATLTDWGSFFVTLQTRYLELFALAVIGNLVPLFCLQSGISRIRPVVTSFLIGLSPLAYLVFQVFTDRLSFAPASAVCVAVTTAVIIYGVLVSHRMEPALKVPASVVRGSA